MRVFIDRETRNATGINSTVSVGGFEDGEFWYDPYRLDRWFFIWAT